MFARLLLNDPAEAGDPDFLVERGCARDRIRKAGLAQQRNLRGIKLLAAKILRVDRMRIDEDRVMADAPEHGRHHRAGKTSPHNGDIGVAHSAIICGQMA